MTRRTQSQIAAANRQVQADHVNLRRIILARLKVTQEHV
jgi:hypothetical protein